MVEKTLILKQISGMLCLLNSYSKFTQPKQENLLKFTKSSVMIVLQINGKQNRNCYQVSNLYF